MLTDDEIYGHATGMLNAAGGIYADSVIDFARAIESAVRAEYADVPPEKFKRLYKFCRSAKRRTIPQTYALNAIDNGTYNPKIGGEE